MALTYSSPTQLGAQASDFSLRGVDGKTYQLADFAGKKSLLIIFMCNHCPYVIAVQDRINELTREFGGRGLAIVGINSNDALKYPDDDFESMKKRSAEKSYLFPYLFDESQSVAKAYDAACTPDPYLYENVGGKFVLRYHGRIDDNWKEPSQVKSRDLAQAIEALLSGDAILTDQKPSMGCNIKWK